jgi:hypothetical protein
MLVCESMDICIFVCMVAKSFICRLSRLIPSSEGGGSGSEAWPGVTMRGVLTTALIVTRVATLIPSVPLGFLRVSLRCSRVVLSCLPASLPTSAWWSCEAVMRLSHLIKLDEAGRRGVPNQ